MDQTFERPKMTPKDFFLYLGAAITLYISAGSLLNVVFETINAVFPDKLAYYQNPADAARWSVASLIIVFPLYLFLSWFLRRDIVRTPEKALLSIRKWFVYFTLFIAGATIAGDLITLLNTFLAGEITTRFLLKVLAVFLVAAAVFGYYIFDLRRTQKGDTRVVTWLPFVAGLAVLLVIVGGFMVMGSPATQRLMRFDTERVNNLQQIQWETVNYWQQKGKLPASLADLKNSISGFVAPVDPDTGAPYRYEVKNTTTFTLCATFATASEIPAIATEPTVMGGIKGDQTWAHAVGEVCFDRTIDPDLYPVIKR